MELGDRDMKFWLDQFGDLETKIDEDYVITILYNILCGMKFLNSANLIHRDIKSANILMDDKCKITFCDFGLARV
jgi:serine/threonine protein kinase